jgi:methyl-accepting chemotaxis protein
MQWFTNLTTRSKLLLGFGVLLLLLGVVVSVAYASMNAIQQSQRRIVDEDFRASLDMMKVRSHQNHQRAEMLELLQTTNKAVQAKSARDIDERANQIGELITEIEGIFKGRNDREDHALLAEVKGAILAYRETRTKELYLVQEGQVEEARALGSGLQAERMQKIDDKLQALMSSLEQGTAASVSQAEERLRDALRIFAVVSALALAFGLFMAWLMNRLIAVPLQGVTGVAERVAAGDLTVRIEAGSRSDEVGVMQRALSTMVDKLQRFARTAERVASGDLTVQIESLDRPGEGDTLQRALRVMVENLRETSRELREGFGVLASSSAEILATVSQAAASASETATAVSETSATAEEVKQTAHLSNQKAKAVYETAQKAASVSESGRKAVAETLAGMTRIREQMESLAESVVRLSEQGQAIGEIIATVNDLAEQSNLLAVNAAIEATRAGEYGKGFGVVAQEVKSLAEQSRRATTQVRTILMEVQKATSAAVMATEQGTKAVAAGVKQATEAGESIRALAGSVGEAAQAASQIAASSEQQLVGMDQIASAIANIRQATTQNMAGTKQLEASAQGLQALGGRLKVLVERQRVER